MGELRTMHDIRTLRSVVTRAAPPDEGAAYLHLHRLATEKLRLEKEVEIWQRKQERIEKRLTEIEQQMANIRPGTGNITVESKINRPQRTLRQIALEY
ncbi:MAG: hypothetical protein Q7O66_17990 [Dehalococcoidia bacterium]|nr:hypothetical protein [Dehalococcoidia bacterium]